MKHILVVGEHSYIGTSFQKYIQNNGTDMEVTLVGARNDAWKNEDLKRYNCVLHVAGKAHADVGNVTEETKCEYYRVNCDLTKEVAEAAKAAGVRQFIYPSSMIIYGESAPCGTERIITADTEPSPANFYGDSKWKADMAVQSMCSDDFKTVVVRIPMVYGSGSKGNYPLLSKMARTFPVFPGVSNTRSMIYIENLCEFLRQVMEHEDKGVFYPQNAEYTTTSHMVEKIAQVAGRHIHILPILNPFVLIASKMPGKIGRLTNKAFGNCVYDKELSRYRDNTYQVYSLEESIQRTEGQ